MNDSKESKRSIEFKHFGNYRVSRHYGSELIKIEKWIVKKNFWGIHKGSWQTIYFGFSGPIERSIEIYKNLKQ